MTFVWARGSMERGKRVLLYRTLQREDLSRGV